MFHSIFVHRYKDSNDLIRSLCIKHLGKWMAIDTEDMLKDEYLKYIGNLYICNMSINIYV
jgi:hypothetical protein